MRCMNPWIRFLQKLLEAIVKVTLSRCSGSAHGDLNTFVPLCTKVHLRGVARDVSMCQRQHERTVRQPEL